MQNVEHWPFGVRLSRTQNAGTEERGFSSGGLSPFSLLNSRESGRGRVVGARFSLYT